MGGFILLFCLSWLLAAGGGWGSRSPEGGGSPPPPPPYFGAGRDGAIAPAPAALRQGGGRRMRSVALRHPQQPGRPAPVRTGRGGRRTAYPSAGRARLPPPQISGFFACKWPRGRCQRKAGGRESEGEGGGGCLLPF